jgi:hypothetical protein
VNGLLNGACDTKAGIPSEAELNGAITALCGAKPQDEVEAMMVAQMVATHAAAMSAMRRVANGAPELAEKYGNLANKFLRTYAAQVEALTRYRNRGKQKVTVEHVHVYPGGQAIVGTVEGGGGRLLKSEEQSHATGWRNGHECGTEVSGYVEALATEVSGGGG